MPNLHSERTCSQAIQNFSAYKAKHKVIRIRSFIAIITTAVNKCFSLNSGFADYRNWKFFNSEITGGKIELGFKTDDIISDGNKFSHDQFFRLMLGDDSEEPRGSM